MSEFAVVVLCIAVFALLILCILQKKEMKNIAKQLRYLRNNETNKHINSGTGTAVELIKELNGMLDEMRESKVEFDRKSHALEQMITNISHDLRTPLTSALGYINLIQTSDLSDEEKMREIAIIEKRLIRLEELIGSFFELSKVISNEKEPDLAEINMISLLEEAVVHYYDDFCNKNREIIINCDTHKLMMNSNSNMLMRIFDNLIGNALKHGEGNLTINVTHGSGIKIVFENRLFDSELDITHVFDEFYTTDMSRTSGNTGLGLAIAHQFTEILGGKISAFYEENKFSVELKFNLK